MSDYLFHRDSSQIRAVVSNLFAEADVRVDGKRSWDIQVHDNRFYQCILANGTLGFGEAYMDEWWDSEALDETCFRLLRARLYQRISRNVRTLFATILSLCMNLQSKYQAQAVGKLHYDLGNDFFETMLGPTMQYSCAYFANTSELTKAQTAKIDLICRKLGLQPGMRLLDIGCGWGGFAKYAAVHYGCSVVGVTISKKQQQYAQQLCHKLPVEIRLQDYRDVSEPFDRIVSVGMMEHVGYKNYRHYMETVHRCLEKDGLFLCHTICGNRPRVTSDAWITRYIFPHSMLPSVSQVTRAAEGLFVLEDAHNFGACYDWTLLAWENNFRQSWPRFQSVYGDRFYRMWRFYLLSCAGAFRARRLQLFQFVLSKEGILGGYSSIR